MAKTKWATTRKWDASKVEVEFEKRLAKDGFSIKGIKEYTTLTAYLIEKDGIETEFRICHTGGISVVDLYNSFLSFHKVSEEYYKVKTEYEKKMKKDNEAKQMSRDEYTSKEMQWCSSVLKGIDLRIRQNMDMFSRIDITALRMAVAIIEETISKQEHFEKEVK